MDGLKRLLRVRSPMHSLAREFYTSQEVFDADMKIIFGKHWVCAGVEADVPDAGDVVTVEFGNVSVLIVRDDDLEFRAFHNVCRHRGARLVPEGNSNVGNLVCRYHAWAYDLTGKLMHADHMATDFDPKCHGLKPVHLRSVGGLLFICLAEQPPDDIKALSDVMMPYLAPHDLANTKVAHSVDLIEEGNWKLTMENNRECYHCGANHPELTTSLFAYGFGFSPESMDEDERADLERYDTLILERQTAWEIAGLPSRNIDRLNDITGFRCERLPIDRHGESQTLDTKAASAKMLGKLQDTRSGGLSFWTQPNSWHHFMADHVVTFIALPLSPERTLVRTKWLVHKNAVEGVDYDIDHLTAVWTATNRQDADLVEMTQKGVKSTAYEPGPYSPHTEGLVEKFAVWYLDRLEAGQDA